MIGVTKRQKRGHWHVVFYDPRRAPPRISRTLRTTSERIAEKKRARLESDIAHNLFDPWVEATEGELTSAHASAERFALAKGLRPNTLKARKHVVMPFVRTLPAGAALHTIRYQHIAAFLEGRNDGGYINARAVLAAWLRTEKLLHLLDKVPTKTVPKTKREALRPSEIERIKEGALIAKPDIKSLPDIIDLLASTGMRLGELCQLRIDDIFINLDTPKIRIGWISAKSKESIRVVPIFNRAAQASKSLIIEREYGPVIGFKYDTLGRYIKNACDTAYPRRGITAHWFRHTFITWLVNDLGMQVKAASFLTGHADEKTLHRYVHVTQDTLDDLIRRAQGQEQLQPPSVVAEWLAMEGRKVSSR